MIDYEKMARCSKTHAADEFEDAVANGEVIWQLKAAPSGHDDLLIYPSWYGACNVEEEILKFFHLGRYGRGGNAFDPFDHDHGSRRWTVRRISIEDMEAWWPHD